ncbi:MAG: RDD family protein [Acidimicrobiales bacterium]
MNCPTCGTEAQAGATFCSVCGATLTATVGATTPGQSSLSPYPSMPTMDASRVHDASPYAPWIRRVLAQLIDGLFVIVPAFVVAMYVVAIKGHVHIATHVSNSAKTTCHFTAHALTCTGGTLIRANFLELLIGIVMINIIWAIYVIVAIAGPRGATFGMRALKIRIVTATDRAPVSMSRSVLRYVVYFGIGLLEYVAHILFLVSFLDWLWPLWDSRNQTLHDKAAGTVALDVRGSQH